MRLPFDATLLVVDVENTFELPAAGSRNNPGAEAGVASLLAVWREIGLPIVHLHRKGAHHGSTGSKQDEEGWKPEAAPRPGETVLVRATASAFADTSLDERLTDLGRTTLVVCGMPTHRSVEATVRHASDLGYRIFVVADACASHETRDVEGRVWTAEEVHALSLAHMRDADTAIVDLATALQAARLSQARRRR